jgi:hypothetical protein
MAYNFTGDNFNFSDLRDFVEKEIGSKDSSSKFMNLVDSKFGKGSINKRDFQKWMDERCRVDNYKPDFSTGNAQKARKAIFGY